MFSISTGRNKPPIEIRQSPRLRWPPQPPVTHTVPGPGCRRLVRPHASWPRSLENQLHSTWPHHPHSLVNGEERLPNPRAWYQSTSNGRGLWMFCACRIRTPTSMHRTGNALGPGRSGEEWGAYPRAGPAHSQPHPAPTNSQYLRAPDAHQTRIQHARNPAKLPLANPPPHRVHRRLSRGPMVCYSWHPLPTGRGPCHTTQSAPAWVVPYSVFQHNAQPAKTEALLPSRFLDWRRGRFGRGETPPPIPFSRALGGGPSPRAAAADFHAGWRARARGHRRACWPVGVASGRGLVRALAPTWL